MWLNPVQPMGSTSFYLLWILSAVGLWSYPDWFAQRLEDEGISLESESPWCVNTHRLSGPVFSVSIAAS